MLYIFIIGMCVYIYINMYMEICTEVFIVIHGIFHYMYSNGA